MGVNLADGIFKLAFGALGDSGWQVVGVTARVKIVSSYVDGFMPACGYAGED